MGGVLLIVGVLGGMRQVVDVSAAPDVTAIIRYVGLGQLFIIGGVFWFLTGDLVMLVVSLAAGLLLFRLRPASWTTPAS